MKIVRLSSENVMRLSAVEIRPDGDLVVIGGKNGAGKSSVLNSIAMALVAGMAADKDAQVWIERVGEGNEVSVIIEDGTVKRHG